MDTCPSILSRRINLVGRLELQKSGAWIAILPCDEVFARFSRGERRVPVSEGRKENAWVERIPVNFLSCRVSLQASKSIL